MLFAKTKRTPKSVRSSADCSDGFSGERERAHFAHEHDFCAGTI